MPDTEIKAFVHGVENLFPDEVINKDAASDAKNWLTQDGKIILAPGKLLIGASGVAGAIYGEIFGYKADGSKVHWRKAGSKIQYFNGTSWVDTITGLTATADYTFTNYSSLAGTFTFAIGVDGIFKLHNAVPGSYLSMYDSSKNFKGWGFIDRGRMILWNRPEDKTGLYGSYIDAQNSTVYTTASDESAGSGNGVTQTFTGTVSQKLNAPMRNIFAVSFKAMVGTAKAITGITKSAIPTVTAVGHGFTAGQRVLIQNVVGMTQINNRVVVIDSITDANNFTIQLDTSAYSNYSSGGIVGVAEEVTDNLLGAFAGTAGTTGTVNYLTGAYSITFNGVPSNGSTILVSYQSESSNAKGVTDFTKSATRLAGEGFQFPQDEGGDAIITVLIGPDGDYYSMKKQSVYHLHIDISDLAAGTVNEVFRKNIGLLSMRGAVSTGRGIIFINTAQLEKPEMTILQKNPVGDSLEPKVLFPQFKFGNYNFDDCTIDTYDRYILVACKSLNAVANDTILLCNLAGKTVDITSYFARTFASNAGLLYMGSSITQSIYNLYSGFDDDGFSVDNFWAGRGELFGSQNLKKERKIRLKGAISPNQSYAVYISYDEAGYQLVGTVRGDGTYVDYQTPQTVGSNFIGAVQIGGDVISDIYPYFVEIRLKKVPKFRKRKIKFQALGIGYCDIVYQMDLGIEAYEGKLPGRFRQKQNVSLDGATTNMNNPQF